MVDSNTVPVAPAQEDGLRRRSEARRLDGGLGEWVAVTIADTADEEFAPVTLWRLSPVSVRPPLGEYVRQLWQRRHFILADARAKAFQTSRGTVLGRIWLVLQPFLDAFVYLVIFGILLQTGRGIPNFLAYLVVGVNFFTLLQLSLTSGGNIMPSSQNLLRAFSFPRASVVISWSLRSLLDFLPTVLATMVFVMVAPPRVVPGPSWALFPMVLLLGWIFSVGLALVTASMTARLPDLKFVWPLLGRFWFYGSGIFFSVDRFEDHPFVAELMNANPGYHFLLMSRDTLVYGNFPTSTDWIYLAAWALGTLVVGFVIFWSHEESYGRER
ncbi:ABC transporter permease [Actinomyces sp.]|uniref:ABC transporter permease n=1 Tax=Actinomyces sp. TaxID=29317 RepID=UPI0028A1DD07|nr:ABC transporter permease [Actinomyces sp.]